MTVTIENPSYNEIDIALKKLNITSHDNNKSIPSLDEILLVKPKILQAIKFIREKKKRPDVNSIIPFMNTLANLEFLILAKT